MIPSPGTVLLLNFNADEREAYRDAMIAGGFDVIVCVDPFDALRVAASRRPDAVVTRILQPHCSIDGIELTRHLRADSRTASIRIIITASLREGRRRLEAVKAGCDRFLLLPSSADEIVDAVRQALNESSALQQHSA
jgi:CheY-like chemotaxis protein